MFLGKAISQEGLAKAIDYITKRGEIEMTNSEEKQKLNTFWALKDLDSKFMHSVVPPMMHDLIIVRSLTFYGELC